MRGSRSAKRATSAAVSSCDPSSTTTTSKFSYVWRRTELSVSSIDAVALNAGTITETRGCIMRRERIRELPTEVRYRKFLRAMLLVVRAQEQDEKWENRIDTLRIQKVQNCATLWCYRSFPLRDETR